ncbi:olfactory receptor 52A5 [Alligator mississippiensis]|uniref:olfactory receptor 52A5 n=1 Tax=Alligator mississippiensis TaxID=8496 RepID=UPI0028778A29|nr:olfactory receptor 52A5 [Alligator mississippiensis]
MSTCNGTGFRPSSFMLAGIPGLAAAHVWFAVPFFSMYIVTVVANFTLLFIIKIEESLHEPMYLFLAMLAITDLSLVTSIVPRMLGIFWFNARETGVNACLTQMFFIPFLYVMESGILLAMALDRFIAICYPLRYIIILANTALIKIGLVIGFRATVVLMPAPLLVRKLMYFRTEVIPYSYCAYMAVVQLACVDTSVHVMYGLFVIIASVGVDLFFIALSYVLILWAVFRLPSKEARSKSLGTCGSHMCVVLLFYSPVVFSFVAQKLGFSMAPNIQIIVDNLYFLLPPMLNPLVYGVRTSQLRNRVAKMLHCTKI